MAIRADSYSTVAEVIGFTRHLLDGRATFDDYTRPTLTEVEKFIDRASAVLNVALASYGFAPAAVYANAVSKLACDDWVTQQAVKYVHYSQRNTGIFSDRDEVFTMGSASEFVQSNLMGFVNLGVTLGSPSSEGLIYTAMDVQSQRDDPDDTTREQPLFIRKQFDNV